MVSRIASIILGCFLLLACTQGGGLGPLAPAAGPDGAGLENQAGPVERPAVLVEADPEGDCSKYVQYAQDYEPEEVPEYCLDAYEAMRNLPQVEREPPTILEREPPGVIIRDSDSEFQLAPRTLDAEEIQVQRARQIQTQFYRGPSEGDDEDQP